MKEHEHERMVYWVSPLKMGFSEKRVREEIKPELEPGQKRRPRGSIKTVEIDVRCVFYCHEQNATQEKVF